MTAKRYAIVQTDSRTDTRTAYEKRSNVGLARDFSMVRYDGFDNAFMAARQHAPEGWVSPVVTAPPAPVAKRSHKKKQAVPA